MELIFITNITVNWQKIHIPIEYVNDGSVTNDRNADTSRTSIW